MKVAGWFAIFILAFGFLIAKCANHITFIRH